MASLRHQKTVVVGAGPVGSLAALYAATRGDDVEIYDLRGGKENFYYLAIQESVAAPAALSYLRRRLCYSRIFFRELSNMALSVMPSNFPLNAGVKRKPFLTKSILRYKPEVLPKLMECRITADPS
jgi:glycine/D-amino acid oxidase-like deaminating enzyme